MGWRDMALGAAGILLLSLGLDTYEAVPPETPVLYAFVLGNGGYRMGEYYATFECVRNGTSLDGYLENRAEAVSPINPFSLLQMRDTKVITLGRARRLVHDAPARRDADPLCVQASGFLNGPRSWVMSLFP